MARSAAGGGDGGRPGRARVVELLRASSLLRSLPDEEVCALAERVRWSRHAAHETVFRKNDEGGSMMVVVSGRVKITSVSGEGAEVILNMIDPGQVFGEMALLDGKPRSADAIAATATEVIALHRRDFLPALYRCPEAMADMMEILCGRIRQATAFVEDAVFLDVETRLYHRLRALADQYGTAEPDGVGIRIEHGLSQQELGDSVGLTRVSINRQLGAWRERGLIRDGRGYVVVPDPAKLEAAVREG